MEDTSWLQIAQFIAYVSLTVTGITVAIASLFISYRNNFGWNPVIFISKIGMKGDAANDGGRTYATMAFEFWNRRTYPLVLRRVRIETFGLDIDDQHLLGQSEGDTWYFSGKNNALFWKQQTVEPKTHAEINFSARMLKGQSLDAIDAVLKVTVYYYDPRRNKQVEMTKLLRYSLVSRRKRLSPWLRWKLRKLRQA